VWKDENTGVDSRYIENLKPTPPGIVKQEEVLSVVRHQNPPTLCRRQKMLVVPSTLETYITCSECHVAMLPEKHGELQSNVVVSIEACHRLHHTELATIRASMRSLCRR